MSSEPISSGIFIKLFAAEALHKAAEYLTGEVGKIHRTLSDINREDVRSALELTVMTQHFEQEETIKGNLLSAVSLFTKSLNRLSVLREGPTDRMVCHFGTLLAYKLLGEDKSSALELDKLRFSVEQYDYRIREFLESAWPSGVKKFIEFSAEESESHERGGNAWLLSIPVSFVCLSVDLTYGVARGSKKELRAISKSIFEHFGANGSEWYFRAQMSSWGKEKWLRAWWLASELRRLTEVY